MRVQPRQQLLEVWRAVARTSYSDGTWLWGGRDQRNSISDAEQLLCLMGPATEIATFGLDVPDETAEDVLNNLSVLGDSVEIPRLIVRVITDYLTTYTNAEGTAVFSGGSYFGSTDVDGPTEEQRGYDVVDSFAVSVRLMLATLGFVRVFRRLVSRDELRRDVDALEAMASKRLTAAMTGLLRSFAVKVFDAGSSFERELCRTVNQGGLSTGRVVESLKRELREIQAGLRDLSIGSGQMVDLDNPNRLFECGWSWGVLDGAPPVQTNADVGRQPHGVAEAAPYLYFTVVALDSIQDLFSERTRILGLLDDEQQRLSRSLQLRWDLTQSYWSKIARFGSGRWPLEDIPWRTTDGVESDYLTLLVTSIVVQDLSKRRAAEADEPDLSRVGRVLADLAARARITRRHIQDDPAIALHVPGFALSLETARPGIGPPLRWVLADFAPQLFKRTIRVAGLITRAGPRGTLIEFADEVWFDHLQRRRLKNQLWDQASEVYPVPSAGELASWYFTERVVSCLVEAAEFVGSPPVPSPLLAEQATDMLAEADHLFDQELLSVSAEAGPAMGTALQTVRATLRRAHETIGDRPGTALVLAQEVLRELDRLAAARRDATEAG